MNLNTFCIAVSQTAVWLVLASFPLRVVGQNPEPDSKLTIARIFSSDDFKEDQVSEAIWSEKSPHYFSLTLASDEEPGRDLVKIEIASGNQTIVVPAEALVPKDQDEPLVMEAFQLSPDHSHLMIYTNSQRVWRRNTRGDYWLLNLDTWDLQKLGGDGPASTMMFAKFSPDGSHVAYVRENNLFVQDIHSMSILPLTSDGSDTIINGTADWVNEEELDIRDGYRWSPSGESIAFWQFNTEGVRRFHLIDNTKESYPVITSFAYPKVGETNSETRLGVVSTDGGPVRWLQIEGDKREHYLPHAEWSPKGDKLLVQQMNRAQTVNRVLLADPIDGAATLVFEETDSAWVDNENPARWINDGKALVWLSQRDGWRHAYVANLETKELKKVTDGLFDVIDIVSVDSKTGWIYYVASPDNATQRYLYKIRIQGGVAERLSPLEQPGWHSYQCSPDSKWAIHTYSSFSTPPVVQLIHLPDHSVVRVLANNEKLRASLAELDLPKAEFFQVDIDDGVALDAWAIHPPRIDLTKKQKYPLLVYVYGEPYGQTVKDSWDSKRGLWHRMMSQQGCVVVSIDNRGTFSPRGRQFRRAANRKIGIIAPQEQAAATLQLLQQWPYIDPARVGIWGWSGGGSMSLNAIFRYPKLYHTAIAVAPNANQLLYDTIYQERYMGLPNENAENYHNGSPLNHASKLEGNLMLVHGTGDDNCHYQGTEYLINELIAHGKHFTVMPYPNRSHAIGEGENTVPHFWGLLARYLQDNLVDESSATRFDNRSAAVAEEAKSNDSNPTSEEDHAVEAPRTKRKILGWTIHIHPKLLADQSKETKRALELLEQQLDEIVRVLPAKAVAQLRMVPLYFSPPYPGTSGGAEFHPGAQWLRDNGRDPAMEKAVEFTNIANFEAELDRMPNFALHELAHGYHCRSLPDGYENPEIKLAFERAKASGTYNSVERWHGTGKAKTQEKAYGLSNPMEYFAESTEAYFSRNDFYPYTAEELKRHDPKMFELLGKLWGTTKTRSNSESK